MTTLPRRAPRDVRTLFSSPVALVLALLYIASAGSVVAFFPKETQVAHAAVEPLKPLDEKQRAELVNWWDLQPKTDVPLPADGSKVQVLIFSDYQCPHCRAAHEAYRSIFAKYAGNKAVHLELKHFPLEGECNSNAPQGSHLAACEAAAAVVLSRATGKAATMEDWLFENQATLTPSVVRQAASAIGGIADFNGEYAKALNEVRADANLGGLLGVNSTPTLFVNGRKLPPGLIPANYVDTLIELELQRAK
jgi:protein-disulfide isomerase